MAMAERTESTAQPHDQSVQLQRMTDQMTALEWREWQAERWTLEYDALVCAVQALRAEVAATRVELAELRADLAHAD